MTEANPIDMTPYCGDDYDRAGCTAVVKVTEYGYGLSIFAPNGAQMESYRSVKSPEAIGRMLRDWCEGKVPCVRSSDADPSGPHDFVRAAWRGTTSDGQAVGVSFDLPSGYVVRLMLDVESALQLADSVVEQVRGYGSGPKAQSLNSSGSEKRDGSPQEGQ